jgi:pyruvate,water dikinase
MMRVAVATATTPSMSRSAPVLWLDALRRADTARVGGKLARLGVLASRGFNVPPGFALPVGTFRRAVSAKVRRELAEIARGAASDLAGLDAAARQARALVETQPLPAWLVDALAGAYEQLVERLGGLPDPPTAVRSSGVGEDGALASFAGQFDSYLGICGVEQIAEHVKKCWASQYTARALDYHRRQGLEPERSGIAVGVLALVDARSSGVAFSVNPATGNRTELVIESSWGLGESVVSGRVTPDRWLVDRASGEIRERHVSDKQSRSVFDRATGRAVDRPTPNSIRTKASLTDEEIGLVAGVLLEVERQEECLQDLEWAIDARLALPDALFVLQHRPETVWSRQPRDERFDPVAYALQNVFGLPGKADP